MIIIHAEFLLVMVTTFMVFFDELSCNDECYSHGLSWISVYLHGFNGSNSL